jgi:branched-subunit amino acid ABC-type transport system permease component
MNIESLIASSIDGLTSGSFGLMAMGLTLIFGVMKVINLGHGHVIVMGIFAVLMIRQTFGINPYVGLLVVIRSVSSWYVCICHRIASSMPGIDNAASDLSVNMMLVGA